LPSSNAPRLRDERREMARGGNRTIGERQDDIDEAAAPAFSIVRK